MSTPNKLLVFLIVIAIAVGISLLIPDVREAVSSISLAVRYGRLSIGDSGPIAQSIYVLSSSTGEWEACPDPPSYGSCQKQSNPDGTVTLNIKAQIYDLNGDCGSGSGYNVNFYVCRNTSNAPPCDSAEHDGASLTASFDSQNGNYCNYTADYTALEYWKKYGLWYINVSARDPQNNSWSSITKGWFNVMTPSLVYPYPSGDSIYLGAVNLGSWTDNVGANTTRNTGNVRVNTSWQSSNFTCPTCTPQTDIIIDNSNEFFCIDNDTNRANSCGWFDAVPPTSVWWFPTNGMRRCGNLACSDDETPGGGNLASYTQWYHIYITTGKTSGDYNNTITISSNWCDPSTVCGSGF